MSSTLQKYVEKENLLKRLTEELKQLEQDQGFQRELEFKSRLEELMNEFDKNAKDVLELLQPAPSSKPAASEATSGTGRRKRKLKVYENPNTGEVVETRGGNQKTLKAWKEEHGEETVESWLVRIEE